MEQGRTALITLIGAALLTSWPNARADFESNPYAPIVERNAFGLKPIPPPPPPQAPPEAPAPPAAAVKLTGITSILTMTKALLEITEPGPGKLPSKPILAVGEAFEGVEILAIDVNKNEVRIRNGNIETNITFDTPSSSPAVAAAAPPGAPRIPPQLLQQQAAAAAAAAAAGSEPVVVSSRQGTPSGRNTVVLSGGTPAAAGPTSFGGAQPNYGQANYGQANYGQQPNAPFTPNTGQPSPLSIPPRQVRTPSTPASRPMTREEAIIQLELQRQITPPERGFPPLPPTEITPQPPVQH